jgi:hypothetical protein
MMAIDETEWHGSHGDAYLVPTPPDARARPEAATTLAQWIITAPLAHPSWSQYLLAVVRLIEVEECAPPVIRLDGATHELYVVAINPESGPYDVRRLQRMMCNGRALPYLTPVNVAEQFEATDDEMAEVAALAASAVTLGALWPETADAPEAVREQWLTSIVRTLAHIRGEVHAE